MTDRISKNRRSENMRRIRAVDTKPEMRVRSLAHRLGFRFRLHHKSLPGKPDLVFPRLAKIVEVHGCFWHQHKGCIDSHIPQSNRDYWESKLARNCERDKAKLREWKRLGWKVLVIWECQTMDSAKLEIRLNRFLS